MAGMENHKESWLRRVLRRGGHILAVGGLGLTLTGCTTLSEYWHNGLKVGPNYGRPPAATAKTWIDEGDPRVRSDPDELRQWWAVFNDPVLNDLLCIASTQNVTLRQAAFRVLEARATEAIAAGELFPQKQVAQGAFTQQTVSTAVANRSFVQQRGFPQWDLGFALAWEVDIWGRLRRLLESASAELDASVENYDDVMVTLLGDVASNYVRVRTLEQQLKFVRTNVELQRQVLTIAKARFKGGLVSELDVDQAQSILSQTESQIPELEIRLRLATNRLCVLLGYPPEDLRKKMGPGDIPTPPPALCIGIPGDLVRRRPDVRRLERIAAARCARIGVAEAEFYPTVSILGDLGWSAENLGDLFTPRAFQGSISPQFSWKLLNYGRIANNVLRQDAIFQQAIADYQQQVLVAGEEVENGLVRYLKSQQQLKNLNEAVEAAAKAVKIAIAQYKAGRIDFTRVAQLQQDLVTYQVQEAAARGEVPLGAIETYRALGGGWQIRLDGCKLTGRINMPLPDKDPITDDKDKKGGKDDPEMLPPPRPKDKDKDTVALPPIRLQPR